jgi:hypothetical protein
MTFTIPNVADAEDASQAQIDTRDFSDILAAAAAYTGVLSGCAVAPQGTPDMTVAVAAGTVIVAGTAVAVSAGNVTITANGSGNSRFDLICVDGSGVKSAVAGTAAVNPVFPSPAGKVVLAAVRVPPGASAISAAKIVDKRVMSTLTRLSFGAAGDASLYRYTTNWLWSDSTIWVGAGTPGTRDISVAASGDGWPRVQMMNNGYIHFGPGTAGTDCNLYRAAADQLKTDDSFFAANVGSYGWVHANEGGANLIQLATDGGIYFGGAGDTVLYRSAAQYLNTNAALLASGLLVGSNGSAGQVVLGNQGNAGIWFGSSQDTNFYRIGAGSLKTDGWITTGGGIQVDTGGTGVGIYFGAAADTLLYRSAADTLQTSDKLRIVPTVFAANSLYVESPNFAGGCNGPLFKIMTTQDISYVLRCLGPSDQVLFNVDVNGIVTGLGGYNIGTHGLSIQSPNDDSTFRFYSASGIYFYPVAGGDRLALDFSLAYTNNQPNGMAPNLFLADWNYYIDHGGAWALRLRNNVATTPFTLFEIRPWGSAGIALMDPAKIGLYVKGAASQTADLQQWQNSAAAMVAKVTSTGSIVSAAGIYAGGESSYAQGTAGEMWIGPEGPGGKAGLIFGGSPYDTNLYRDVANSLRTDDLFTALGGVSPGNGSVVGGKLFSGSGVPSSGLGANGDFYFRTDTPGTSGQRIYIKSAGAWVTTGV